MTNFNKWNFVDELQKEIEELIKTNSLEDYDEMQDFIFQEIDNACIYYTDCFHIVMALGVTDFGDATNICELAFISLNEYVQENLNIHALTELF